MKLPEPLRLPGNSINISKEKKKKNFSNLRANYLIPRDCRTIKGDRIYGSASLAFDDSNKLLSCNFNIILDPLTLAESFFGAAASAGNASVPAPFFLSAAPIAPSVAPSPAPPADLPPQDKPTRFSHLNDSFPIITLF